MLDMETKGFDQWAVLELMGHKQLAGRLTEETIAGQPFLRMDVPEVEGVPARTTYHGGASVYAIHPCTEELARAAAARLQRAMGSPLPIYVPQLDEAHRTIEQARRLLEASPAPRGADFYDDDGDRF